MITYPATRTVDTTDTYFGTEVPDPYRWLEDDRAPEVEAWVAAQNEVTQAYLDQIPFRGQLRDRIEALMDYPRISAPFKAGRYYFFYKNDGLQNQSVIYLQEGLDGEPMVFIDPNTLSEDGTVSVDLLGASDDNRYMAYSRSEAGSDWSEIRIIEIATQHELSDRLRWVKFSGAAWYEDGFFYSAYPAPEPGREYSAASENQRIFYHRLGDAQADDVLIYEDPANPNRYYGLGLTEDKAYMTLIVSTGTDGYETWFKPTEIAPGNFRPLFRGFEHKNNLVDHINGRFLVHTDVGAPNYRLVAVDPAQTDSSTWVDIIPESAHLLESAGTAGGKLFVTYIESAYSRVYQYEPDGSQQREIAMPAPGTVYMGDGKREDEFIFYTFTSFTYPNTIYRYDLATGQSSVFFQPEAAFDPSAFEARQVRYTSTDGTPVSLFLVHRKGLKMNGKNPVYLYGYGGFNVSMTPYFSSSIIAFLESGGVFAMPNLRGGGEYGEAWHRGGMLDKKQQVFDDFIAAAEYLIGEGYTSSDYLAIGGGSNGGLLVGACMTQRPELFRVAVPAVGVLDMLRYHRFTVGWGWIPEYGCADSSEAAFRTLFAYSPLHRLQDGTAYPATLVTTADHDDRVVPAHSFKFAARLQAAHAGTAPVLIRIETRAGHGGGKPTSKLIEEQADVWSFVLYNMGISPTLP
ncbi:MAG: prolyl oligopeptidase family serine peptidase [Bacteroidia bacterium]